MKFEQAVEVMLFHEGGFVDNPKDPGGVTNFGISKRAYPDLDIPKLTKEDAIAIYRRDYWDKNKIELLPECLRLLVFDCAINQGGDFAIAALQSAIGAKADGKLGDVTIAKLNTFLLGDVIRKYVYFRWRRYAEHRNFATFAGGWGKRLLDVSLECTLRTPPPLPIPTIS